MDGPRVIYRPRLANPQRLRIVNRELHVIDGVTTSTCHLATGSQVAGRLASAVAV